MARIEDYAFLSDTQTCALVSREGSVDWLCFPRFDSGACFAALLGDQENGRWAFTPDQEVVTRRRRYRDGTLILETEIETASGGVRLIDFMPPRGKAPDIVRIIEGIRGRMTLHMELIIRFDYGHVVPWVRKIDDTLQAIAGPDAVVLRTPVKTYGEDLRTIAEFTVNEGDRVPFVLTWFPSHEQAPPVVNPEQALTDTEAYWAEWAGGCRSYGAWHEPVIRSLITLKGLTYAPTGGIVAAATTSLPEEIGGVRNWDYRYCWLRDATFTLMALMDAGYIDEARAWREWLLRAVAGSPSQMQIMYGVRGERRLQEYELPWLNGYEHSRPVRVGNAASQQFQLDVYGELMGTLYRAERAGLKASRNAFRLMVALARFVETNWEKADHGIWEIRGEPQHFTHSKIMAWVAFDRAIKLVEECHCEAQEHVERWRQIRDHVHQQVCTRGWNEKKKAFAQVYDGEELDASLLVIPLVGFLPASDPRVRSTVEAIERELMSDGFVLRYRSRVSKVDGLPGGEGVFLLCTFWLVNCLHLMGRKQDARALFERLLALRNDVGLLSEEYDAREKRMLGNFPQAFSHVAIVTTARILSGQLDPESRTDI